jgi:hypothetical protein
MATFRQVHVLEYLAQQTMTRNSMGSMRRQRRRSQFELLQQDAGQLAHFHESITIMVSPSARGPIYLRMPHVLPIVCAPPCFVTPPRPAPPVS